MIFGILKPKAVAWRGKFRSFQRASIKRAGGLRVAVEALVEAVVAAIAAAQWKGSTLHEELRSPKLR